MQAPDRSELQAALTASRLYMPLDIALQSPALCIALRNTAHAMAVRKAAQTRLQPVDHKRLAAGDID